MRKKAGINGFGRFGIHLLKYWLDRSEESSFQIHFINDDSININEAINLILDDDSVVFNKYKIKVLDNYIRFQKPNNVVFNILFTNDIKDEISWIGKPDIFFECSGKNTLKNDNIKFLKDKTEVVIISATSWDADSTVVYGFNHQKQKFNKKIISYGSCTVNAYVPLAYHLNKKYGIIDSDVNVIHNIQKYRLDNNNTLNRKFCTLQKSGINLLNFLNINNFIVNYTVVPYTGVSIIDYRFRLKKRVAKIEFLEFLNHECLEGKFKGLYHVEEYDLGPEVHNCTTSSSVFISEGINILNDQLYLFGYFDNENSVNRFYDLACYISLNI